MSGPQVGQLFPAPAAVALQNAQLLAQAGRFMEKAERVLASRAVTDQAVEVLRIRSGGTTGEAFDRLRTICVREHRDLLAVASVVVQRAVDRARARGHPTH